MKSLSAECNKLKKRKAPHCLSPVVWTIHQWRNSERLCQASLLLFLVILKISKSSHKVWNVCIVHSTFYLQFQGASNKRTFSLRIFSLTVSVSCAFDNNSTLKSTPERRWLVIKISVHCALWISTYDFMRDDNSTQVWKINPTNVVHTISK